ncbi:MAG: ABC transporter ATP-binding protein [SAR86 cluster bacterium]|uniref:ABC transporter ATP-binding protein n=1 Tax=SAR86 cluster bacterium TaxID=2030880 RepID=A0A520MZL5_9GAMM|nr:ABC transporter ATP-binding protein [SAR86 cluster bacterium]RZO26623.1 MAG: ABC transporter ATP-binding protein [SAR86 cluster bacterium]|tara:strand:- start:3693 stop:5318 length:1626 start_codon:yes stop_codon:yes gene_type:complete
MSLSAILQATTVFGIIPIVDYVSQTSREDLSTVSKIVFDFINSIGFSVSMISLGLTLVIVILLRVLINFLENYFRFKTIYDYLKVFSVDFFSVVVRAKIPSFEMNTYGKLSNTLTNETQKMSAGMDALMKVVFSFVTVVAFASTMFFISPALSLLMGALGLILFFPITWLANSLKTFYQKKYVNNLNFLGDNTYNILSNIKLVKGFGNEEKSIKNLDGNISGLRDSIFRSSLTSSVNATLTEPLIFIIIVIIAYYSQNYLELGIPLLVAFMFSANRLGLFLNIFFTSLNQYYGYIPSYRQFFEIHSFLNQNKEKMHGKELKDFVNRINFDDVSFSYDSSNKVLNQATFNIKKGEKVAIVGESGAGKSTIIDLIMGFQKPTSGSISFDNANINELSSNSIRKIIGYVPQKPTLIPGTLRENFQWSKENITDEEINNILHRTDCMNFMSNLQEGLDTEIGNIGDKLSGGQIQRLCLARALGKNPGILILDEPTSSLDKKSEIEIKNLLENLKEITILCVTHRREIVENFDKTIFLDKGKASNI